MNFLKLLSNYFKLPADKQEVRPNPVVQGLHKQISDLHEQVAWYKAQVVELEQNREIVISSPSVAYTSQKTRTFLENYAVDLINETCKTDTVDPLLIRAIAEKESGLHPLAVRVEPHLMGQAWFVRAMQKANRDVHHLWNTCSFGLMQILYVTAMDHYGTDLLPSDLLDPVRSLRLAIVHLKTLMKRYESLESVLSAYNAGTPTSKNMENYVEPILRRVSDLRG